MNEKTWNVQSRGHRGKIRTREKQRNVPNGAEKSKRRKVREAVWIPYTWIGSENTWYHMVSKDPPHNCAQPRHIIPADPNFEKKRNSSALFAREINLVTQPSFDCEQGINSQVQTACSNADAIFPVLGIVFCKNERFSLLRKTHVPLWNEPRISHVRLPWAARTFRRLLSSAATDACWFDTG